MTIDVEALRRAARERAAARPTRPFDGVVADLTRDGVPLRRYVPDGATGAGIVFLHGGYGVLGDLDLQDGWCRRLGEALGAVVLSVGYRLAPESTFDDSVADALTGLAVLADGGFDRLLLCGDSAGGAVAIKAAALAGVDGLVLTNPNVDLTFKSYDVDLPGGPDRELSTWAFRSWFRVDDLTDAPRLDGVAGRLPPTVVAVGTLDSLLPEARALADACQRAGVDCRLVELAGAEHGFAGTERVTEALAAFRTLVP